VGDTYSPLGKTVFSPDGDIVADNWKGGVFTRLLEAITAAGTHNFAVKAVQRGAVFRYYLGAQADCLGTLLHTNAENNRIPILLVFDHVNAGLFFEGSCGVDKVREYQVEYIIDDSAHSKMINVVALDLVSGNTSTC
jgi:hypothetical protein